LIGRQVVFGTSEVPVRAIDHVLCTFLTQTEAQFQQGVDQPLAQQSRVVDVDLGVVGMPISFVVHYALQEGIELVFGHGHSFEPNVVTFGFFSVELVNRIETGRFESVRRLG
jgi:hypothetical protein